MKKILVTDGEQRSSLAVVRSLGRAGYEVHVCSARSKSLAAASRYCAASYVVADPLTDPQDFLADLTRIADTAHIALLLPMTEPALLVVLPNRDRFTCAIPFPPAPVFEAVCDKELVLRVAASHGMAVPAQVELASPADAGKLTEMTFPVVLKPSRSVAGSEQERIRIGVAYASNADEARAALNSVPDNAYPILVQQRIVGEGFAISVLLWDGDLLAAFAHRRIREKPPSGGVSVLRDSIPIDQDLLSQSLVLLRDLHWQGVAMVEYKRNAATGVPYLMEINGRLWGSLQLAIDAQVDFPRLLVEAALGAHPAPVTSYEAGVRSRWEWGDFDNLLAIVRHHAKFADFSEARRFPRARAVAEFIRAFGGKNRAEVFRRDDLGPILRETLDWFRAR